jgi:hypothetical protein
MSHRHLVFFFIFFNQSDIYMPHRHLHNMTPCLFLIFQPIRCPTDTYIILDFKSEQNEDSYIENHILIIHARFLFFPYNPDH